MKSTYIHIEPYQDTYRNAFYDLNIAWLRKYFVVEPYDEQVLSDPEKHIIKKDGHVFFALSENKPVGTVALIHRDSLGYELSKMAVTPAYQGRGIGRRLIQHCIAFVASLSNNRLYLDSNRKLETAIGLYRKMGFEEIPLPETLLYDRCDIRMWYNKIADS